MHETCEKLRETHYPKCHRLFVRLFSNCSVEMHLDLVLLIAFLEEFDHLCIRLEASHHHYVESYSLLPTDRKSIWKGNAKPGSRCAHFNFFLPANGRRSCRKI